MFSSIATYLFGSPSEVECAGSNSLRDLSAAKTLRLRSADGLDSVGLATANPSKKGKGEWVMISESTSGEDRKSRLPVGPLENELIEHPSMSVYHSRGRPSSVGHCSSGGESVEMAPASTSSVTSVSSKRSRRAAAVAAVATAAAVVTHTHSSHSHELVQRQAEVAMRRSVRAQQAKKQRKEQKQLKRSQLQRCNNVAQKLSARPPRRNQLQSASRRSHAVNDRKSQ